MPRKSSPARLAANRANALRSTGPRTAEGKARSSQNATTHGLTASQPRTGARSAGSRTVTPSNPNPRPIAAIQPREANDVERIAVRAEWCTSAPYASSS